MKLSIGRVVHQKKFELILKYVKGLKTPKGADATADHDKIVQLFKRKNIPMPDTWWPDPDIIMILFYLTTYPTAEAPLLSIRIGTEKKDICFIRN